MSQHAIQFSLVEKSLRCLLGSVSPYALHENTLYSLHLTEVPRAYWSWGPSMQRRFTRKCTNNDEITRCDCPGECLVWDITTNLATDAASPSLTKHQVLATTPLWTVGEEVSESRPFTKMNRINKAPSITAAPQPSGQRPLLVVDWHAGTSKTVTRCGLNDETDGIQNVQSVSRGALGLITEQRRKR